MANSLWGDRPLPFKPSSYFIDHNEEVQRERRDKWDSYSALPIKGIWNREALAQKAEHTKDGINYRGFLDHSVASWDSMAEDYTTGYLAQNTANIKYVADRISGLMGKPEKYTGTILSLNESQTEALKYGSSLSGWNVRDQWGGIAHGFSDITDMLLSEGPSDWDPMDALDLLFARDPERAGVLVRKLGSKEILRGIIKDTENPVEFFYRLSDAGRKTEIAKSIDHFYKTHSWATIAADFVKNLLINGVANDPDLATSTAVSLLLGVVTMGVGSVAGVAYQAGKGAERVARAKRHLDVVRTLGRAQQYLPELIGPTLLRKYVWKESYKQAGFWGKSWRNVIGNAAEGTVTGFLAEFANQRRRVYLRHQEEISWGRIAVETGFEALISPMINPGIGRIYMGIGAGAKLPLHIMTWGAKKGDAKFGALGENLLKWQEQTKLFMNPDLAESYVNSIHALETSQERLGELLVEGTDHASFVYLQDGMEDIGLNLSIMLQKLGFTVDQFAVVINSALESIAPKLDAEGGKIGYHPEELFSRVYNHITTQSEWSGEISKNITPDTYGSIQAQIEYTTNLLKRARDAGISPLDQMELDEENGFEAVVHPDVKEEVKERLGDNFEGATQQQLMEEASKVYEERETERRAKIEEGDKEVEEVVAKIEAEVPPSPDATPPPKDSTPDVDAALRTAQAKENLEAAREAALKKLKDAQEAEDKADKDLKKPGSLADADTIIDAKYEAEAKRIAAEAEISKLDSLGRDLDNALTALHALTDVATKQELKTIRGIYKELRAIRAELNKETADWIKEWNNLKRNRNRFSDVEAFMNSLFPDDGTKNKPIKKDQLDDDEKNGLELLLIRANRIAGILGLTKTQTDIQNMLGKDKITRIQWGKVTKAINTALEKASIKITGTKKKPVPSYQKAIELEEKFNKKKAEVNKIMLELEARHQRVNSREFTRTMSRHAVILHRLRVKESLKVRKKAFDDTVEARVEEDGDDARFLRKELMEETEVGGELVGGWLSPESTERQAYNELIEGLGDNTEGIKKVKDQELTVEEATKIIDASHKQVLDDIKFQVPQTQSEMHSLFNRFYKDTGRTPAPVNSAEERAAESTPGTPFKPKPEVPVARAPKISDADSRNLTQTAEDFRDKHVSDRNRKLLIKNGYTETSEGLFERASLASHGLISDSVYHETDLEAASLIMEDLETLLPINWTPKGVNLWVGDRIGVAKGMHGQGYIIEMYARLLNGPEHFGSGYAPGEGREFIVEKYLQGSFKSIIVPNKKAIQTLRDTNVGITYLDFNNVTKVERGYLIPRKPHERFQVEQAVSKPTEEVTNVLGDPVQLDENNNFLKSDDGKPQLIYRTEHREYDLEAWDPDKDTELQEVRDKLESIERQLEISSKKEPKDPWKPPFVRVEDDGARGQRFIDEADGDLVAAQKAYDASDVARIDFDAPRPDNPEWQAAKSEWMEKDQALRDERRGLEYRSREIHTERRRVKPFDWSTASSEELFFTSSEDVARTYQGQKRGGHVEGVEPEQAYVVIRQPIIIDAGGWNHNALQKDAVLAGLPQRMKDWLNSVAPNQLTMLHHTTENIKNSFENWIKYEIDNGTPGDKLPNAIIYKNIVDPGKLQAGFSKEELTADTVYVRGIEQVVKTEQAETAEQTEAFKNFKEWGKLVEEVDNLSVHPELIDINGRQIIPAVRVQEAANRSGLDSKGLGIHIVGRVALVDSEGNKIEEATDSENHGRIEELWFDIDRLHDSVTLEHARSLNELKGWVIDAQKELGENLTTRVIGDGSKDEHLTNPLIAMDFINELITDMRPFLTKEFDLKGFISEIDGNGSITYQQNKHSERNYIRQTKIEISNRLHENGMTNSGQMKKGYLSSIMSRFNITPPKKITLDIVTQAIVDNFHTLAPEGGESFTLVKFGNGVLDYASPKQLGSSIVDILSGKDLAITRSLTAVEAATEGQANEGVYEHGQAVRVTETSTGEMNRAAPIALFTVATVVNNEKFHARQLDIDAITEFTQEQKDNLDGLGDLGPQGTTSPLGVKLPYGVKPELSGGHLDGPIASRPEQIQLLNEFLMDIPNLAISLIHDNIRASWDNPLRFAGTNFSSDLSHGDDIRVPLHQYGEVVASDRMGPNLNGLTVAVLEADLIEHKKWREGLDTTKPRLEISDQSESDRIGSGIFEWKLNSLAADPHAITALIEILKKEKGMTTIKNDLKKYGMLGTILKHRGFTAKELNDFYAGTALRVKDMVNGMGSRKPIQDLGRLKGAFAALNEFTTVEAMLESKEPIVAALRGVFKVPVMRWGYRGGQPNFRKEFGVYKAQTQKAEGRDAIKKLGELLEVDFYSEDGGSEIEALGRVIYELDVRELSTAVRDAALYGVRTPSNRRQNVIEEVTGVDDKLRTMVKRYLSINQSQTGFSSTITEMTKAWEESLELRRNLAPTEQVDVDVEIHRTSGDVEKGTVKTRGDTLETSIIKVEDARKLFEDALERMAHLTFGPDLHVDEAMSRIKEKYRVPIEETEKFLAERKKRGKGLLTNNEIQMLTDIWRIDTPETNIPAIKSLNMLNASAFRIQETTMRNLATAFGLSGMEIERQFSLLRDKNIYFNYGTSPDSNRLYIANAVVNLQGRWLDRVTAKPEITFDAMIEARKEELGTDLSQAERMEVLVEFMDTVKDAEQSLGAVQGVDNPFHSMPVEEAKARIEHLSYQATALWLASQDKLPTDLFPVLNPYSHERLARVWSNNTQETSSQLSTEKDIEEGLTKELLELKRALGFRSRDVARREGRGYKPFKIDEHDQPTFTETSRAEGVMALQPEYSKYAFSDRGVLALQGVVLQQRVDRILGPLLKFGHESSQSQQDPAMFGWKSAWDPKDFPAYHENIVDYLSRFNRTPEENQRAASLMRDIDYFVRTTYGDDAVANMYKNPEFSYPHFYLVREIANINKELVERSTLGYTEEENANRRDTLLNRYHLLSSVQRRMKETLHSTIVLEREGAPPFGITAPIKHGETYGHVLTRNIVRETPIHQELTSPIMGIEGMPILPSQEAKEEFEAAFPDGLTWGDLISENTDYRIIQGRDSKSYLPVFLFQDYVGPITRDFIRMDGTKPYENISEIVRDPRIWEEVVAHEDRPAIWKKAIEKAVGEPSRSLEMNFNILKSINQENTDLDLLTASVENVIDTSLGTAESHITRSQLADLGFAFQIEAPREFPLIAGKYTVHLTPEAALSIFHTLDNIDVLHNIREAKLSGRTFGYKKGMDGNPIPNDSIQESIRRAIGFTTSHKNESERMYSDALDMIIQQTAPEGGVGPVRTSAGGLRTTMDLIDLDLYQRGLVDETGNHRIPWIEARVAPIQEAILSIRNLGFDSEAIKLSEDLVALVEGVRTGSDDRSLGIATILSSLIYNPIKANSWGRPETFLWMLDPNVYDVSNTNSKELITVNPLIQEAASLFKKMSIVTNPDSFIVTNPVRYEAEAMAYDLSMGNITADEDMDSTIEETFEKRLKKAGLWDSMLIAEEGRQELEGLTRELQGLRDQEKQYKLGSLILTKWQLKALNENIAETTKKLGALTEQYKSAQVEEEVRTLFPDIEDDAVRGKIASIALHSSVQSQESRNRIREAHGMVIPHVRLEGSPNTSLLHDIHDKSHARTHKTMMKFVAQQPEGTRQDLQNAVIKIRDMGLDQKQTRLLRTMLLHQYGMNPLIIKDTTFDLESSSFAAEKATDGNYYVRFGAVLKEINKPGLTALEAFGHEMTHIARLKFIRNNGNEWRRFKVLSQSGDGKSLIKKLVLAWHGGRWTKKARGEYNKYLGSTEEFIAGLGMYHLLSDLLPDIKELTQGEADFNREATSIVERMLSFVHGVFTDLNHTWSKTVANRKDISDLMSRLFGMDPTAYKYSPMSDVGNPGGVKLGFEGRFDLSVPHKEMSTEGYIESVKRLDELKKEPLESLTTKQVGELRKLEAIANFTMDSGITIETYYGNYNQLHSEMVNEDGHLDYSSVYKVDDTGSLFPELKERWAVQYLINRFRDKIGNEVLESGSSSSVMTKFRLFVNKIIPGLSEDSTATRTRIVSGLTGHVGSEFTYAPINILSMWLSNLLDSNLNYTESSQSSTEGEFSVTDALAEADTVSNAIKANSANIKHLVTPIIKSTIIGSEVTWGKKLKAIINDVNSNWAMLVEDPDAELIYSEETLSQFENKDKVKTQVEEYTKEMARVMRTFMIRMQQAQKTWEEGTTTPLMGYQLSEEAKHHKVGGLVEGMGTMIHDRIKASKDNIQPHLFYAARTGDGDYLLPDVTTAETIRKDLYKEDGSIRHKGLYNLIIGQAWKESQKLTAEDYKINSKLSEENSQAMNNFIQTFKGKLDTAPKEVTILVRKAVRRMLTDMADGTITWKSLKALNKNVKKAYNIKLGELDNNLLAPRDSDRLGTLFTVDLENSTHSDNYRSAIAFRGHESKKALDIDLRGIGSRNALNVMVTNFVQRTWTGNYIASEAWWVPRVSEAIRNPEIRKNLALDPSQTVDNLKRGLFNDVAEQELLAEHFGIKGRVTDIIDLMTRFAASGTIHNPNGTQTTDRQKTAFKKSIGVIEEKYQFLRGHQEESRTYGTIQDGMYKFWPAITKVAYAGNLGVASLVVEHTMNVLVTSLGEGRLLDGLRTLFTPLTFKLQGEDLKLVGEDFIDLIEGITRGHLPDYDSIASDLEVGLITRITEGVASQGLRIPKHILKASVSARAMTMRKAMYDLVIKNSEKFRPYIEELNKTEPTTRKEKKALMKKHNISWMRYAKILDYYRIHGVLHPQRVGMVEKAMVMGARKDKLFVLNQVISKMSHDVGLHGDMTEYSNMMAILGGIKRAEGKYIHEVMVDPNAFDIYTGTDRMGRTYEVFRRFPVLWVSQMMFRRSSKMPLMAHAGLLSSMLVLDLIYMMSLRLAAGTSYEDLMDDLEAKGVSGFMLYYGARLPIFGRWYGEVAAATAALSMGKDIPSGFIPAGAFASVIKNAYNIASGIISEDSVSEQEMINAARIFPIVGDTFVRLGIYGAFGDMIEKKNSSSAASTRGSQYHEYQHMGLPPNFGTTSYEAMLAEFYKQLGIEPSWPAYEKNFNNILGTPSARQRRDANSQLLPEEPVTAAATARKPVRQPTGTPQPSTISDPVQGIQEASKALEAPDRLIETD